MIVHALKYCATWMAFLAIVLDSLDPIVTIAAMTLWVTAYWIGQAWRPGEETPDTRITVEVGRVVEEVDLEVQHIPELDPITVGTFEVDPNWRVTGIEEGEALERAMKYPIKTARKPGTR